MRTKCAAILVAIATVYVAIAAGGKAIEPVPDFDHAPARRLCAHRGFCTIAPENGMAAFGAAVALGASEMVKRVYISSTVYA